MNQLTTLLLVFFVIAALMLGLLALSYIPLWLQVNSSGIRISIFALFGIKLRRLNPNFVCHHIILLRKAGLDVQIGQLESHMLAGGNLGAVSDAIVSATKAGLDYSFDRIAAIDLAGRNVVDAVNTSVMPKVLVCPGESLSKIMGVAKDGVRLGARVRITVRTNFERLIGGANEKTIIARVGEGIVAAIGSAQSHKEILEKPELISRYILTKGLDRGSSFEILSVDVSDLEVIDNVGARLQEIQADTDKSVAQAKAEMRRVYAVAREREMRAKVTEMTSQLTFAKSIIPREMTTCYRKGKIWRSPRPVQSGFGRKLWDCSDSSS